jgi:two-component system CheB/CheR fusion protein
MSTSDPHHIIAIGASAGGMEEINLFFDHTPLDGVAYVIIQHLSADFKSRMVELLSRHSKLEVFEAENGTQVKCNEVYLIPNDSFMTIRDGRLYLTNKDEVQPPHLTINKFFISLALDCGDKAIGVVLSGLGSDGTEGVKAIKKTGGMIIVRNPETSPFSSMPASAIATGLVDFVLEPELMPSAIEDYVAYGGALLSDNVDDEKNMLAIVNVIREKSPLDFSEYKQSTILRRTKRRAAYSNFISLETYLEFLKETPEEVEALAKDFLISVTSFFRDREAFECLQDQVVPNILAKILPGEELKVWVAGCATGEEVYSIAIIIAEQLADKYKDVEVKIFATDIDTVALSHAGKALYTSSIEQSVSPERLAAFFSKEGSQYRVKASIRRMVIFAQHDLVKNPPYCNMHLISCRNLLIYMTPVLQKKIFSMLLFGLKLDGYLLLGASESPMPIINNLEIVNKKWKIYKNLEAKRVLRFDSFLLPELLEVKHAPSKFLRDDIAQKSTSPLAEAVNSTLIGDLDYLVVCVDENNVVIKTYGDTTKFLLQKNFNSKLDELLPIPLAVAFNAARTAVLKSNKKVAISGIGVAQGASTISVSLSVSPLILKKGEPPLLMATLKEDTLALNGRESKVFDEKIYLNQYTLNIEEEVKELKDKLRATYEQLDASYENMQSFNEELLSANEEMQSTNEEMQSVNEELDTINSNYQQKNKELVEINDDLNNYFRSNVNGQLFINKDLLLMRFSPGIVDQINLLPSDIGRPLSNISTNIKFETIIGDVKKVIEKGSVISKEIETNNNKWYQIMTMPYISQVDDKICGAVITFNDITELKNTQLELAGTNKNLMRINEDLDNFVHVASHDLIAPLNSIEGSIGLMNALKITNPELDEFLKVINSSVLKFRTLIKDIAAIGKMESSQRDMEMVDIDEIITNIEWSLDGQIKKSNAIITRSIQVKHIHFSKKNLRSIIYNLVSNGIKFTEGKPPIIEIESQADGDYTILSVKDNGIGISRKDIHKIFELYGRLHHVVEGDGIGLYLAKKIVDAANGNIVVESELGKGSKFMLYFKTEGAVSDSELVHQNHVIA